MMTVDPSTIADHLFGPLPAAPSTFSTPVVIGAMLDSGSGISDLIFSPGRPPQVEKHGELTRVDDHGAAGAARADDTARLARDIIGGNPIALRTLQEQGACDLSYSLPERARFRVNVFRQRGTFAIVMRVIASKIPTLAELEPAEGARRHRAAARTASCSSPGRPDRASRRRSRRSSI